MPLYGEISGKTARGGNPAPQRAAHMFRVLSETVKAGKLSGSDFSEAAREMNSREKHKKALKRVP